MSEDRRLEIRWDRPAGAWHLVGRSAGPAGAAGFELGSVWWSFDRVDPSVLVEAFVPTLGDAPGAPLVAGSVDVVDRLCGSEVARTLISLGSDAAPTATASASLAAETGPARALAGRLAMALEVVDIAPAPSWWTVEAAASAIALGTEDAGELATEAFDLVDSLPGEFLAQLAAGGLADPLRAVLNRLDHPDHDLPAPLRLAEAEVDAEFDRLVERLTGPLQRTPAAPVVLGAPTFRRRADDDGRLNLVEHPVEWIDVPCTGIRRATWSWTSAGAIEVRLGVEGSVPPQLAVRSVSLAGRAPVVLSHDVLVPTAGRHGLTTLSALLDAPEAPAEVRVELVLDPTQPPLAEPGRSRRHAVNLARSAAAAERLADAEVRLGTDRADEAARLAADLWNAALDVWQRADPNDSAGHAAACARYRDRLRQAARPGESGAGVPAGWTESVVAATRRYLVDASAVGVTPAPRPEEYASLAGLAESVDDIELAARFRAEQARGLSAGDGQVAMAGLAVRHYAAVGQHAPRDLRALGERGG